MCSAASSPMIFLRLGYDTCQHEVLPAFSGHAYSVMPLGCLPNFDAPLPQCYPFSRQSLRCHRR